MLNQNNQGNQSGQCSPQDAWLQHPAIGVSPDSFIQRDDGTIVLPEETITARPPDDDGATVQDDGTIVLPEETITAKPPDDSCG